MVATESTRRDRPAKGCVISRGGRGGCTTRIALYTPPDDDPVARGAKIPTFRYVKKEWPTSTSPAGQPHYLVGRRAAPLLPDDLLAVLACAHTVRALLVICDGIQ